MKNRCLLLLMLFVFSNNFAQQIVEKDVNSTYLSEIKVVKVYLPKTYEKSERKYPLTIVLDADELFDSYVATSKLFAKRDKTPEQIIVAISQDIEVFRQRDYGYQLKNSYPTNLSQNVYEYIAKELIPFMKENYRVANFKTIVGNELTANFANYFLLNKTPVFNGYININPFYAQDMPEYLRKYCTELKGKDCFYYLAHGNDTQRQNKKTIDAVDVKLTGVANVFFSYKFEYFDKVSNVTTIPQSIASSIDHIFSTYTSISKKEYEDNIAYLSPLAAMEYLQYKYENIEYLYGAKVDIRKEDFIAIEGLVIDKEEGIHLEAFGELALELFPKEPLGDYYLGLFYEKQQDYRSASLSYKRGYVKIPTGSARADGFFINIKRVAALLKAQKTQNSQPRGEENIDDEESTEEDDSADEGEEENEE